MPQLDFSRIFSDSLILFLGACLLIVGFLINFMITGLIECVWFGKFKVNLKIAFKYYLLIK